jgi:CRISPR/Cas system-associated exonuclease Cas4 (RecB family)
VTTSTLTPLSVDADVLAAAALAAGQDVPGASPHARQLAEWALSVADRQVMDDIVEALADAYVPSGNRGPRVSDVGSCRRSVYYRETPPEGFTPEPRAYERAAALGSIIHAKSAEVRAERYPWRRYEFEIEIPGLDKKARVDEYDPVLGEVTDDKTAGNRRWEMVGEDGPAESAWSQAAVYAYALDEMGMPVRSLRIIVINRDNGAEEHFRREYDPAVARAALDDLIELATMLDLGIVPPRDGSGPTNDWQCRGCVARSHCWNIPAATDAGRSPESFTILGAAPDDPTIIWAGEKVMAARELRLAAERAEKDAKVLIDGIPPGEYGDLVIKTTRREMPEYKESFERAVQLYELPDQYRPAVAEVAEPVKRIDRYTTVSRKRAAKRSKKDGAK